MAKQRVSTVNSEKSLLDIMEMLSSGKRPEYEELYYGMLALIKLVRSDRGHLSLASMRSESVKKVYMLYLDRHREAAHKKPADIVAWDDDPNNPLYQERIRSMLNIYERSNEK